MKQHKISTGILISTYNWPQALESSLISILRQSRLPDEILIADDGSGEETRQLISRYQRIFKIPVKHVWQEDKGFRKSSILNKAMKLAEADYIIQIDGDIVLHEKFIHDHIRNARKNKFVQGARAIIDADLTATILRRKMADFSFTSRGIKNRLHAIRIPQLSWMIRSNPSCSRNIKACNLAFWRADYVSVNGYDNHFHGWGWEDDEFAARLINSGLKKRRLKLAAICYHLNHTHHSRYHIELNRNIYNETVMSKRRFSANGLAQV